ncbi:MAG: T9SS type B sorting domain-containing protein [Bacteroidetes bacterium]|nr:T9SS type B sorting domain-containing protein [Bacteroidota bacterium]
MKPITKLKGFVPIFLCGITFLLIGNSLAKAQKPVNDSCSKAIIINLGNGGFGRGLFISDSVSIDSATIQTGEYFHSSLVSAGNDKKSVWYRFYIPSRRGVNIELKQHANAIATKDCGFTTYKSESCLPTSTMATASKITTLNQFGSSFNPCMDPGWYMVQVSAKSRAAGKIYLEITTSYPYEYSAVVNAKYDVADSAYRFGNTIVGFGGDNSKYVDFELGCYTIDDSSEFYADLGANYLAFNQSAWFTFQANKNADNSQIALRPITNCVRNDSFAYRLYKGDCRSTASVILLDSAFSDWNSGSTCSGNCSDVVFDYKCRFDSGEFYSIQFLFHEDQVNTMRLTLSDQTGRFDSGYHQPKIGHSNEIGVVRGNVIYNTSFTCNSYISDNVCGNANASPISLGNFKYNLSQWVSFDLDQQSALTINFANYINNYKRYDLLAWRLFKDTITSNCSDVDTMNIIASGVGTYGSYAYSLKCLEPGKYSIQLLGSDSLRDYSNWKCSGTMHLGGDYRLTLTQSQLPVSNRFSLATTTSVDSVNNYSTLIKNGYVTAQYDTVSCNDALLPEDRCEPLFHKAMYRTFVVGDADKDGRADSGLVYITNLLQGYVGYPYYNYHANHRIYKGDAKALRAAQSGSAYPDTLFGLTPYSECIPNSAYQMGVCVEPGIYTLVSTFDSIAITLTERPNVYFYSSHTKHNTYATAEFIDSISGVGSWSGERDTISCSVNPDTIDGNYCGRRNTYHVFYLDTTCVLTASIDYGTYAYGGRRFSLYSGDIRNGKSGLKVVNDGSNWSCLATYSRTISDCFPLSPGFYTVVISEDLDVGYDSLNRENSSGPRLYQYPHKVYISTRASTINPKKYYRPSLAAYADSLVNNNQPLSFDTNYSSINGMQLKLKKYQLPREYLECDLDTPLNYYPKNQLCDTGTTDIVYYTFNLEKYSFVKIWGNTSGGTWDSKLYNLDVRTDSAALDTAVPVQNCNYNPNYMEFCGLPAGTYSLLYFCERSKGQTATVYPVVYIDSIFNSRFDRAANAYDFGRIPGDGNYYDGKVGDVHPLDTALPPSHDFFTCKTGVSETDPTSSNCGGHINPRVYLNDSNIVMFPYDSVYQYYHNQSYYPWSFIRRNLWYSFVIRGRGNVTVDLKGLTASGLQNTPGLTFRYSIYESDEDGSLSMVDLKSMGKIDSTLTSGLTYIANDYYYCYYTSPLSITFPISACESVRDRRYYVLVDLDGYNYSSSPAINSNVWLEIKYDSAYLPDTRFDYYSTANKVNGLNDVNLLQNPGFENSNFWTSAKGNWYLNQNQTTGLKGNHAWAYSYYTWRNDTVEIYQDVDMTQYASQIVAGTATLSFSGYLKSKNESTPDDGRIVVEYRNASGTVLSTYTSSWYGNSSAWTQVAHSKTIPVGTKTVRVRLQARNNGVNYYSDVYFDEMDFRVSVPNSTVHTTLKSNVLYRGDLTYFAGSTIDTTDIYHSPGNSYSCYTKDVGGTVWYKVEVDSVGYMFYNYVYHYFSSGKDYEGVTYNSYLMRVYRSDKDGDSLGGLTYMPPISTSSQFNSLMGSGGYYICVQPGTYYIQLNKCNQYACSDYIYPQIAFDFHTGDFCNNAVPLYLDTLESQSDRLLVNCHTMGNDFGEDGSDLGCLFGPNGYKSSWFVVHYTDTTKIDLEFKLAEYTTASANEIRYRTYYGNCQSLTPAPCNTNALTTFTLDCLRDGTYYVQIVTPENATGELEMTVEAKENHDSTCFPVDIFQPNAAFYYNTACPENVVEFINTSSRGDSIRYFWDFGYNGWTDTVLNPVVPYPALKAEITYNVKLRVVNIAQNSSDSLILPVTVPFAPYLDILNNDTVLCKGDSVTLNAVISHGKGIWSTGDTSTSITVSRTGKYFWMVQDKKNILDNPSFEKNPVSTNWTVVSGNWQRTSNSSYGVQDSSYVAYVVNASGGVSEMYQDVDVSLDSIEIDSGIAKTSLTGFLRGYQTYGDAAQVTLEYLDKKGNLLAIYRTDYWSEDYWNTFTHSRTTPVGTRTLRVRVEADKISTNNNNCYAFIDGLVLKMRSACEYKDSVYVQVNLYPKLDLPSDTFFCKGDSLLLNPDVYYDSPYVVQDSMNAKLTGSLKNNASHSASNGYVELTSNAYNQNGQIEWTDSDLKITDTFTVSFDMYSGGDGGYALWLYLFNSSTPTSEDVNAGGYSVNFDEQSSNQLQFNWSGSRRNTTSPGVDMGTGKWINIRIEYANQTFKVYSGNMLIASFTDATTRTQTGYKFGLGARNGGYYNIYRVKNFHISKNNPSFAILLKKPKVGGTYLWSDGTTNDSTRWITSTHKLSLKFRDAFGCESNTDSTQINVVNQYDSLFTASDNICVLLDTFYLTKPVSTGYFYGHQAVDSQGMVLVDSASFGSNTIYFSVIDTFGCIAIDTGSFIIDSIPDLQFTAAGPFCKNDSPSKLQINHSSGYFFGGTYIDSTGIFDPAKTTQRLNRVYYATFDQDCRGVDSIDVIVDSLPVITMPSLGEYCLNSGLQQLPLADNNGFFEPTLYLDSSGLFNPVKAGVGVHRTYFTLVNSNGCFVTDSADVTVDSLPNAAITPAGPFCKNSVSQKLTGLYHNGVFQKATYIDTAGNFSPAIAGVGSKKVYHTVVDNRGCSNKDSLVVQVNALPNAAISSAGPFCFNRSKQLLIPRFNKGGVFTKNTYIDSIGWFTPQKAGTGSHKVYYTFTDANGCSNTDSITVQVDTIPDASIAPVGPLCLGDTSVQLIITGKPGGTFTTTSWLDTNGIFTVKTAGTGSHKVYYSVTDGQLCSNKDSITIKVNPIPDASITPAGPFCENSGVHTIAAKINTGGYFSTTAFIDSAGHFNPAVSSIGNHKIFYSFTDSNSCSNTDSTIVHVDSIPDASIMAAGPFCENGGIQLISPAINSGGFFTKTNFLDSSGYFDPAHSSTGDHSIYYSFTDGNGCSNTDSTIVHVDSIPDASITSAGPFCENGGIQLISPTINSGGFFTKTGFIDSSGYFDPAQSSTGDHSIYYSFTDGNGCSNTDSTVVHVDSIPDASIATAGPFCLNAGVQIILAKTNSGGFFTKTIFIDSTGHFDPVQSSIGDHPIYYSFTDGNGCSNTDSITIHVDSIPDASITPAGPFCENGGVQLISPAINSGGFFTKTGFIDSAGHFDPAQSSTGDHRIYYSFMDGNGCSNTDSTIIHVDSIPDASITSAGPFCENGGIQLISPVINSGGFFTKTGFIDSSGYFDPAKSSTDDHRIYYSFTDGSGCSNTDSTIVHVDSIPDASIASAGPFCMNAGVQIILAKTNSGGYFTKTGFIDSSGYFDPVQSSIGDHLIYYSFTDGNGCSNTDSTIIHVDSIPDASITAAGPFCENGGVQLISPAINSGGFFAKTNFIDSAGYFDPAQSSTGDHPIYYSFTDGNGCSNTDSTIIHVDSIPDASITSAGPFCENGRVQLISPAINSGGFFTKTGFIDSAGHFDPAQSSTGNHRIYYSFTDGNGCSNTDSTVVHVDSIPDASIALAGPFCMNAGVQIILAKTNSGGYFTKTGFIDSSGHFDPVQSSTGDHPIYYSFTDGNGCSNTDSAIVHVDSLPDVTIQPAGPFCLNDTISAIKPNHSGGTFIVTNYIDVTGKFNPLKAGTGISLVQYQRTDGNGCSDTGSLTITVDTLPNASITPAGPFCENASVQNLSAQKNTGTYRALSYVDTAGHFVPSFAGSGDHKVYHSFTDARGCRNTDSTIIHVDTVPDASITPAGPFCANAGIKQMSGSTNPGGTFKSDIYIDASGKFDPLKATSGLNKIYYTYTNSKGCSDTDSTSVQVDSIPDASIIPAGPFCENSGPQKLKARTHTSGSFTITPYLKANGDFDPAIAGQGVHRIYYSLSDSKGCANTDSIIIEITAPPDASLPSYGPYCANDSSEKLIAVNPGGTFSGGNYITSNGVFNPGKANITDNTVLYTLSDTSNCFDTKSIVIQVNDYPHNSIYIDPDEGCEPLEITFSTEPVDTIIWKLAVNTFLNQMEVTQILMAGDYHLQLHIANKAGCFADLDTPIHVYPLPVAAFDFNPKEAYLDDPTITFINQSSSDVTNWLWEFGDGEQSNQTDPVHRYVEGKEYPIVLIVTNDKGCRDTASNVVVIRDNLIIYIPNAISTNNKQDGLNSVFRVVGIGYQSVSCQIFNRWGEKIFEADDFTNGWDGTYQDQPVQAGVYVYTITLIDYKGRKYYRNGTVTVVK